jgi:hypothetical protein
MYPPSPDDPLRPLDYRRQIARYVAKRGGVPVPGHDDPWVREAARYLTTLSSDNCFSLAWRRNVRPAGAVAHGLLRAFRPLAALRPGRGPAPPSRARALRSKFGPVVQLTLPDHAAVEWLDEAAVAQFIEECREAALARTLKACQRAWDPFSGLL